MGDYEDYDSQCIKHMEFLQAVIARLGNEAALVRGWALTVAAAFFGFAAKTLSWQIAAVGLLPDGSTTPFEEREQFEHWLVGSRYSRPHSGRVRPGEAGDRPSRAEGER